jgi:WD40 repeat protein
MKAKAKAGGHDEDIDKKFEAIVKTRPKYNKKEEGVKVIEKLIHRGWITKIKYYADLNYVISSSLDGFIHIHDIENLSFKENKTFALHQKGVNSFIYSSKHRFMASCGEERHIIMWDPFTRHALSYLNGHTTSVQDLALNEERYHLISLGTDKVVRIWHTNTYICIQTIFDKICYRPEDRLTSLWFDHYTNNILLGSRKVNLWSFKTQEEIKTSHEYPVAFALNNGAFESVVSADDGGFIAVWDLEDGKLMSKFGGAHGAKNKITAGCFDNTQRRVITAGSDGTCKMWNFSNGQCLTELKSTDTGKKVDTEITALVCVHDPELDDEE